jgi:arylsulfatase A-like enzyme
MYSVAYGTTPSHASLFTSRYAREHGVYNNRTILPARFDTLAEIMALHGAETAAFVSSRPVCRELGLGQGFVSFDQDFKGAQRGGHKTADRFVAWLRGVDRWFFAWIHFMDAHRPYSPPPRFGKRYLPEVEERFHSRASYGRFDSSLAAERLLREEPGNFHEYDRRARGLYRGEIEFMDEQIGKAIDALKIEGLYDRTLIVVVADHGENFADPEPLLAFGHDMLHKHVVRLPLIVKLPRSQRAGDSHDFLAESVDIAPTIVAALGLEPVPSWNGRSMLPAVFGDVQDLREHVVLEGAWKNEVSVRTERWVYRRWLSGTPEDGDSGPIRFHDLVADPSESRSISGSLSPAAATAFDELDRISREFTSHTKEGPSEPLELDTPEHLEALKALGYVQ